jgi:hypothetical protein
LSSTMLLLWWMPTGTRCGLWPKPLCSAR